MTVANRLKFTVAITSAATITPPASPNVGSYRTLAQAIAAGDVAANTTGVPLICEDASNNWEESYFTVSADGLSFTRTSVAASSAGGTTPATFTGTVTVYCTMFADYVNKLLISTNATDVATLTNITPTTGHKVLLIDPSTGLMYTALVSAILALSGAAPAAATAVTLGVSAASTVVGSPVTVTVSTNNPLTGSQTESVTLTAPVAGTWSANPVTLNATTGTATPTFTPSAAGSGNITATASGTPTLTAGSVAYAATATVTPTLTVATPASPQTVGTSFTVTGTWTGTQPTALDVLLTDNGTPGAWGAATTGLVINANGTYQFTATPTTASTSRTITVRDHNATTVVSNQSSAYVVNAAVAPGQVTGLTAGTATSTTQPLTWTAPSTGTAPFTYKVERSAAGANTWTVANASVSGTSYTVTGLTASTSYDYRVSATNSVTTGTPSATVTKSTAAAGAPTYNITQYGGPVKSSLTSADQYGVFSGKALFTPTNASAQYWVFNTTRPASAMSGWSNSATVPPLAANDPQNTDPQNGLVAMSLGTNPGEGSTNNANLNVTVGSGTTKWYYWIVTGDGYAQCMTPSGVSVTV